MEKTELAQALAQFAGTQAGNFVDAREALSPALSGMRIFDAPLLGAADAADPLFARFQEPEAVGPHYMPPARWLPEARTVLSFFLPFTQQVRRANAQAPGVAPEWLHGRIEGQRFVAEATRYLVKLLREAGGEAVAPSLDGRFRANEQPEASPEGIPPFCSNWSERHAAYACGLGTFGLSKGLITRLGVAGRFGSVVTTLAFPPDRRPYGGVYDYCNGCGACARRCPAGAISPHTGKAHPPCKAFLDQVKAANAPRFGCGKCQTGVPCEGRIPPRKNG